jgi:hypothetical protein
MKPAHFRVFLQHCSKTLRLREAVTNGVAFGWRSEHKEIVVIAIVVVCRRDLFREGSRGFPYRW